MGRPRASGAAPQAEGLGWAGGPQRTAAPSLPLALPFGIQLSVEETLGTQQACLGGVVRGVFFGAVAPHTPSSPGLGSRAQSLCVLSHFSPRQMVAFTSCPLGRPGAWGGWCRAVGAGKKGTGESGRAPRS